MLLLCSRKRCISSILSLYMAHEFIDWMKEIASAVFRRYLQYQGYAAFSFVAFSSCKSDWPVLPLPKFLVSGWPPGLDCIGPLSCSFSPIPPTAFESDWKLVLICFPIFHRL